MEPRCFARTTKRGIRRSSPLKQQTCRHRSAHTHTHIKANAAVLIVRHRVPLRHRGPVAFQKGFLLVVPSFFLSESGSGSKSSLHVMRSLSGGNTKRVERGGKKKRGAHGKARREKVCIAKKKKSGEGTGEQQDAGQGGNNNRPLTLTAVTRTAASPSREPNPVSGLGPRGFVRPSFNRLRQF